MFRYSICVSEGASLTEPVLFRGSYLEAFSFAKELGAQGIEIHLRDAADMDGEALRAQSKALGIQIAGIATGLAKRIDGLSLVDDDLERREAAIRRVKGHLDLAARFGCPVIIGSMRSDIPSADQAEMYRKRLEESLRILARYIEKKDCFIVLEAINRYEDNYLNTADETADFIQRVGSGKIKLLLDLFHMAIEERDTLRAIRRHSDVLGHIHIADNDRHYPGHGQVRLKEVLQTLRDIRYHGWLSLEYLPIPSEEEAAERGMRYMRLMEQLLELCDPSVDRQGCHIIG